MRSEVAQTYCVLPVLENLLDVDGFEDFCAATNIEFSSDIVRGYAFSVVCTLAHLINRVLDAPQALGFEPDRVLQRARFVGLPYCSLPSKSKVGKLARNLVELYRPFLGVNDWSDFKQNTPKLFEQVVKPLKRTFDEGLRDLSESKQDKEFLSSVLKYAEAWFMDLILFDYPDVRMTYENVYKRGKMGNGREPVPMVIDKKQNFFEGYRLALEYLWYCFFDKDTSKLEPLQQLHKCKDWDSFDDLYSEIRAYDFVEGFGDFEESSYLDSIFKLTTIGLENFDYLAKSTLYKQHPETIEETLNDILCGMKLACLMWGITF
jgi:hypothetical protein